jgi:hypothetical protein
MGMSRREQHLLERGLVGSILGSGPTLPLNAGHFRNALLLSGETAAAAMPR